MMTSSKPTLSFSQMLVRAQWRHDARAPSGPPAPAPERRPATPPPALRPVLAGAQRQS